MVLHSKSKPKFRLMKIILHWPSHGMAWSKVKKEERRTDR